jgi:hypothetical protein
MYTGTKGPGMMPPIICGYDRMKHKNEPPNRNREDPKDKNVLRLLKNLMLSTHNTKTRRAKEDDIT